ncbi:AI-2 transport protein TqsA [Novipirellula galeiformis]|uniref:AI-2 transport protein TqsA n=1 Tax=Novipirellula galeiformis TaxID=2528004 RepID=A0A5C6CK47_9BACT|nr:AI-2E family transporter [Novipirellula galeiformis]TWU25243.1 AI-2 transport protein TqsA [Novipirellula galeiformis]
MTCPPSTTSDVQGEVQVSDTSKWHRRIVLGIFLLLLVGGLGYAQVFLTPVILGFLLALVFSPVRRFLERCRVPTGLAAATIVLALLMGILLVTYMLAGPVVGWVKDAPSIGADLEARIREIRQTLGGDEDQPSVDEVVAQIENAALPSDEDVQEVVVQEQSYLGLVASTAPAIIVQIVMVMVLLFFLLASGDMFYEKIVHVMPTFHDKRKAIKIARDIERKLSRYLLTITLINASLGITIGLAMWMLGMPNPLLFAVVGFLFNYVPYLGAIAGSMIALIVGLLSFEGVMAGIAPAVVYYLLTAIEGQFVTPYFVGRNLKLNTVVVFIAVAFWAWLWSVVGMLVAVPLLVTVRTFSEHIPHLEPLGDFLSARGAEAEDVEEDEDHAGEVPNLSTSSPA